MQETQHQETQHRENKNFMASIKNWMSRRLPDWAFAIHQHWKHHGVFPNLVAPRTFNEKILYRKLFDRRPLLTQIADKAAARLYVEARLGQQILPKLYHLTICPEKIPFDDLPDKFVIKPTHASGRVQIVTDKSSLDRIATMKTCADWLGQSYYRLTREWQYKHIEPRILIEEFIDEGTGAAPNDYKVFVFGGNVELIQFDTSRFIGHRRRLYSPDWEKINVLYGFDDIENDAPPPPHLSEMIAAAEILGDGLDFIRVDFYDTGDSLYFGELTSTPDCGWCHFKPNRFDRYLGRRWKLPAARLLRG
ncbi:MAG TPA: ATP-grasp fold amidoligase family protein [Stellaceae bacterium]|nr:ATP-grasp fold amidoligase family protein [Stellaceae bacterium]